MKRAVGVADCRHAVGEAIKRKAMKRAVVVEDCRHAVGETVGRHDMKRLAGVADCRQAVGGLYEWHVSIKTGCKAARQALESILTTSYRDATGFLLKWEG
jgi:hypothetical protein